MVGPCFPVSHCLLRSLDDQMHVNHTILVFSVVRLAAFVPRYCVLLLGLVSYSFLLI